MHTLFVHSQFAAARRVTAMNGDFDSFSSEPSYTSPEAYSRARARTTRPSESLQLAYRLVWVVVILAAILFGPTVIRRFQYANTYGIEKAKVDVALEGLGQLDKLNLQGLEAASRLVAQRVGPGVVHIRTARVGGGGGPVDERQFLCGLPQPRKQTLGQGSGVVMDESGFIVTNNHVIDGATGILVQLSDGSSVPAKVIGTDPLTDLAVLKINSPDLIAMPWGDSDQLEVGDLVWAVGSPFGLDRSVTFGIVSAKNRRGVTASPYQSFLQSDAAVNPGNSGGPLVNIRGEVVGINTAIVGESYQGISFAIPATTAEEVYQRIKSTGKVARGWLGVALQEVDEEIAREAGLDEPRGFSCRGSRHPPRRYHPELERQSRSGPRHTQSHGGFHRCRLGRQSANLA